MCSVLQCLSQCPRSVQCVAVFVIECSVCCSVCHGVPCVAVFVIECAVCCSVCHRVCNVL